MDALMKKLGIKENQVIETTITRKGKTETTDTPLLSKVRKLMNNTFIAHTNLVNDANYMEKQYERDSKNRIVVDANNQKVVKGYITKTLTGQFLVEDNKDGTHTLTRFNVYKDHFLVDSNSLSIAKVTNGTDIKKSN